MLGIAERRSTFGELLRMVRLGLAPHPSLHLTLVSNRPLKRGSLATAWINFLIGAGDSWALWKSRCRPANEFATATACFHLQSGQGGQPQHVATMTVAALAPSATRRTTASE